MAKEKSEYQRDAYISKVPSWWGGKETHLLMIDLTQPDGTVAHQAIAGVFGKNNALKTAEWMNQWRDQTCLHR